MSTPTIAPAPLREINGVSLLTRSGKQKSRYTRSEILRILWATEDDLQLFLEIFAPRQPYYVITRNASDDPSDWTTPRNPKTNRLRRLQDTDVLKHLCGNLIPGRKPRWVAPRAWEATCWVGIDVDFQGDRQDFRRRCKLVHRAFKILGVPREGWLISDTSSGGRHYRFFTTRAIRTADIPQVMSLVGLQHKPGQIEIFPSMERGMRLPFGHISYKPTDPQEWVSFVRKLKAGTFPRVDWLRCMKRAGRYAAKQFDRSTQPPPDRRVASSSAKCSTPVAFFGIPRWKANLAKQEAVNEASDLDRYLMLVHEKWDTPVRAQQLWDMGIQAPGTRVEATKRLAWHFIHVRKMPVDCTKTTLTEWVYRTGQSSSEDVKADLRNGTRKVESQTIQIVDWSKKQEVDPNFSESCLTSESEIDWLLNLPGILTDHEGLDRLEFALRLSDFAKKNGVRTDAGWEVRIAVKGILRKWPKCSGMRYKAFMDWAVNSGLITLVREKKQTPNSTGRPRTYRIHVPVVDAPVRRMTWDEAVSLVKSRLKSTSLSDTDGHEVKSDTYKNVFSPPREARKSKEEVGIQQIPLVKAGTESDILVTDHSDPSVLNAPKTGEHHHVESLPTTTPGRLPFGHTGPYNSLIQKHQHSSCPGDNLAECPKECPEFQPPLSRLPHQNPGSVTAHSPGLGIGPKWKRKGRTNRSLPLSPLVDHFPESGHDPATVSGPTRMSSRMLLQSVILSELQHQESFRLGSDLPPLMADDQPPPPEWMPQTVLLPEVHELIQNKGNPCPPCPRPQEPP